jgi:hypothetical protein
MSLFKALPKLVSDPIRKNYFILPFAPFGPRPEAMIKCNKNATISKFMTSFLSADRAMMLLSSIPRRGSQSFIQHKWYIFIQNFYPIILLYCM